MKRYLVFALFILASLQVTGQSSCKINHFYQQGTTTDITEVAYNAYFDMELVVAYNPQDQATDKLKILVQLPAGDNTNVQAGINAFPIVISSQNVNYFSNILEIEITGFSFTQQSTFTINIYNVKIAAVASCPPVANVCSSALQYYNATNGSFLDFPNNVFSATIYGKHSVGSITTQLVYNDSYYSSPSNDKDPFYVDLDVSSYYNTYVTTSILLHLNSSLVIKKVIVNSSAIAQVITVSSKQYYSIPKNSYVRVYFDLPENSNTITLSLTGEAIFSDCASSSTVFPIIPITKFFTGKPDDAILSYPSIYLRYNYIPATNYINMCGADFSVDCYLDNIYNTPISVQQPIVMIADIAGNIKATSLSYEGSVFPDKVYVRICGNTNYELTPLTRIGNIYNIPTNVSVDKIRLEFLQVASEISRIILNGKSISVGACSATSNAVSFELLKNEQDYITKVIELKYPGYQNSVYPYYAQNKFAVNQEVRPEHLSLSVSLTLEPGDYLSYELSDNMTFPENPDLQFSFNNLTFQSVNDFNAQYFSNSPITYKISTDRKKLFIENITIKGMFSDCSTTNTNLYIKVTTKVSAKPSSISNSNVLSIKNSAGSTLSSTPFDWSVIVTQAVTNTVFFSCDGGTTRTAGITIKKDDAVNVYYTLENTTLYKYDQKTFTFYCTLPTAGLQPALLLIKTTPTGNIIIPSIITPDLYSVSYATGNLDDYGSLTYTGSSVGANILQVRIPAITVNAYEKLILSLAYPATLGLTNNNAVRFYAKIETLLIPPQSSALIIGPKSDCDLFNCVECITSFSPTAGEEYILSAWVKESFTDNPPTTYKNAGVRVTFNDGAIDVFPIFKPTGPIVDGWQRIEASFVIPAGAKNIHIALVNDSPNTDVFFDDIRVHPYNSNMKSFVYNPSTQKLVAELDENNFATMYEYDDEGILIRVKKETERGVMTIKETRSNQSKIK